MEKHKTHIVISHRGQCNTAKKISGTRSAPTPHSTVTEFVFMKLVQNRNPEKLEITETGETGNRGFQSAVRGSRPFDRA